MRCSTGGSVLASASGVTDGVVDGVVAGVVAAPVEQADTARLEAIVKAAEIPRKNPSRSGRRRPII
jgi:hypothetical protein